MPRSLPAMRAVIPCGCTSTSAPICCSALTWKSTGRRPIRSPPTRGTKASWARCSSGPSRRIGMRFRPENSRGTRGVGSGTGTTVIVLPAMSTSRPIERRMSAVMLTSPTSGALLIVDGESARRAATMCLVTAFFAPATTTSPRRGPLGSMCHAGPAVAVAAGSMGSEATSPLLVTIRSPRGLGQVSLGALSASGEAGLSEARFSWISRSSSGSDEPVRPFSM